MNLATALHGIAGRTDMFAVRAEGEILSLTRNLSIRNWASGAPMKWVPTFGALVGDNWQVMDAAKLNEMLAARAEQGG